MYHVIPNSMQLCIILLILGTMALWEPWSSLMTGVHSVLFIAFCVYLFTFNILRFFFHVFQLPQCDFLTFLFSNMTKIYLWQSTQCSDHLKTVRCICHSLYVSILWDIPSCRKSIEIYFLYWPSYSSFVHLWVTVVSCLRRTMYLLLYKSNNECMK